MTVLRQEAEAGQCTPYLYAPSASTLSATKCCVGAFLLVHLRIAMDTRRLCCCCFYFTALSWLVVGGVGPFRDKDCVCQIEKCWPFIGTDMRTFCVSDIYLLSGAR
jgi:hypothetical protein